MEDKETNRWFDRYKKAKTKKAPWLDLWQYCGKYIPTKKQNFTEYNDQGQFLVEDVFDSTGPKASRKMASAMIGMMWQGFKKSIRLNPPEGVTVTQEVKDFYEELSSRAAKAFDDPRAGFILSQEEYMVDQSCFGTSGIGCFEGTESDLLFQAWGVDEITIEEGENGFVRTIYREFEITVSRAAADYGLENLSEKVKEMYKEGKMNELVKFLHIIAPHSDKNSEQSYESLTYEFETKKKVKTSGFFEFPVPVSRFYKRRNEVYGRSPGMDALSDILEINATKEARISAIEKSLDPPLGVYDDSLLGNEEVDTSAGGINVFATSGRIANQNPIFPLFTVETIREADKSIEDLMRSINEHFNVDRLLDFNNETRMTLGEAQMRQQIRSEALGSLFARQQNELYTPLIERGMNVLYRKGRLGVIRGSEEEQILLRQGEQPFYIPDEIAKRITSGLEYYEIEYITPAARMLETAEAQGVLRSWEFAMSVAQVNPDVIDNLDPDKSVQIIARSEGAPDSIIRAPEIVEQIRGFRAQQMQQQQMLQQAQQEVDIAKTTGEAGKAVEEGFPEGADPLAELI
jgi:hypothetical protein